MKEFLLVFRADLAGMPKGSPEEMQARTKGWMDWIGGIAAQDKLKERGNRLNPSGRVLKSKNLIIDGPFLEIKESILGYSIITADSYDEAVKIAEDCPIFEINGSVEVREVSVLY